MDGVVFVGATLWTDYRLYDELSAAAAMMLAERAMNDHRVIRRHDRLWEARDAQAEFEQSAKWLDTQVDARAGRCIVVTHTAPSLRSICSRYQADLLTAAFASNLQNVAECAILWVHGHSHVGCDYHSAIVTFSTIPAATRLWTRTPLSIHP